MLQFWFAYSQICLTITKNKNDLLLIINIILLNCNICVEFWVTGISETSIPVARWQCGSPAHAQWSLKGLSIHACRKYRFIKTNNEMISLVIFVVLIEILNITWNLELFECCDTYTVSYRHCVCVLSLRKSNWWKWTHFNGWENDNSSIYVDNTLELNL